MTADLYNDNAYLGRKSAWHLAGQVAELPATEAHKRLGVATEEPLDLQTVDGDPVPWHVVVRRDDTGKIIHVSDPVSGTWTWLPHGKMAAIANDCMGGEPVETIGLLGKERGDRMFLTYPARKFDIEGSEHEQLIFIINSLKAGFASRMGLTTIRMVCSNTVDAGLRAATVLFRAAHHAAIEKDTRDWFESVIAKSEKTGLEIEQALVALAGYRMDSADLKTALPLILPLRKDSRPTGLDKKDAANKRYTELHNARVLLAHDHVLRLFDGEGTGLDQPGYAGTALGAFNALVEYADFHWPSASPEDRAAKVLVGDIPRIKANAYQIFAEMGK